MKLTMAALIAALCATVLVGTTQVASQELPVGEFRVVPSSGPIGTIVTVSGDFDREITIVSFWCINRDTFDEGFDYAHTPAEASPSFTFDYEIPAELPVRQGDGATISPSVGECYFRAEAGHQHASVRVPFIVTEAAAMPSAGFPSRSRTAAGASTAVILLAAGGVALGLLGWRSRRQRA